MAWKKMGLIHSLSDANYRSSTHMQGPVPVAMQDKIRVYFAARNTLGQSYPAFMDIAHNLVDVLNVHDKPIMPFGPPGSFDDEGIMPACVVCEEDSLKMYYSGWNRRVTVPYHNTTGIAISDRQGSSFQRLFDGPVLDRMIHDPLMVVTPWVTVIDGHWKMWYVAGLGWVSVSGKLEPVYGIKYAESKDGIAWQRNGLLAIPRRHPEEAIARPTVLFRNNQYHMWYCFRDSVEFRAGKGSYRIGYAFSKNGVDWERADHLSGISPSQSGWDAEMQCYPYILEMNQNLYMFYNGNAFGQSGIGCAIWEGELPSL